MAFELGDVFIGTWPETQAFGARPDFYNARYGLKGHNGIDFGCPSLTLVLAAASGTVSEVGFDQGGYGNYLKIHHGDYVTLYGHLNDITVGKGDTVISGQLVAHSDNTGNSDGPHLHFGVAPCDTNGNKTEQNNGYSGYIDPNSSACTWVIKNLTAPAVKAEALPVQDMTLPSATFVLLRTKGTNYDVVVNFLLANGLNEYLSTHGFSLIDLNTLSQDPKDGDHISAFLAELVAKAKTPSPSQPTQLTEQIMTNAVSGLSTEQKTNLLSSILSSFHNFIFTQH